MSENLERLGQAYMECQGLDEERARQLAAEVSRDPEVMSAALIWVETGLFDDVPNRQGYSPSNLKNMSPSGVFATLVRLRSQPKSTLTFLRRDYAAFVKGQK
jgi:hypothetical protein